MNFPAQEWCESSGLKNSVVGCRMWLALRSMYTSPEGESFEMLQPCLRYITRSPQLNEAQALFGLSVVQLTKVYRRFKERFPEVNVTYLADDQRAPYGPQPPEDVVPWASN